MHLLRITLTLIEMFPVIIACMWPVALTLQLASEKNVGFGVGYFLTGLAGLAMATLFRRDRQRLLYLAGPFALLTYSALLVTLCGSALIRGNVNGWARSVTLGASVVFLVTLRWITLRQRNMS